MTIKAILFWIAATLSLLVALTTLRFIPLGMETAFPVLRANSNASMSAFLAHILASSLALGIAVPQFLSGLRARRPALHRVIGRLYVVSIAIGGVSGGMLAISAMPDRPIAGLGFGLLAMLWLGVTARAFVLARARRIPDHRRWMIRSFALTFAAVTLRLELPILMGLFGMDYPAASNIVGWLCWVPNLIVAELLLRRAAASKSAGQSAAMTHPEA